MAKKCIAYDCIQGATINNRGHLPNADASPVMALESALRALESALSALEPALRCSLNGPHLDSRPPSPQRSMDLETPLL